jgi:hypothetical protein
MSEFAMNPTNGIATNCIEDIKSKIILVSQFPAEKMFDVYSEDDLLDKSKLIKTPYVGVMYEGSKPVGGDASRQGMAAETYVAVVLGVAPKSIGGVNSRNEATMYLDAIRNQIKTTRSPTQHKWRWAGESFAGVVGNQNIYIQRWATFTPLTT